MIVVFDFDGTIADSFETILRIFRGWSTDPGHLTEAEIERMRDMSARQVMRELAIPWWRAPWLVAKGRREMAARLDDVALFEGMAAVLRELTAQDHQLAIVSSNSEKNIRLFLRKHHIEHYFAAVVGSAGLFSKARRVKHVVRSLGHGRQDVAAVYIGDEVRDIETARRAGVTAIAVDWGFNSSRALKAEHPDAYAQQPKELLGIVAKVGNA